MKSTKNFKHTLKRGKSRNFNTYNATPSLNSIKSPDILLLKKSAALSLVILLVSSYTPEAMLFSGLHNDTGFLSDQDKLYNLAQIQTSPDGFLIKNSSMSLNSNNTRLDFIEHEVLENQSIADVAKEYGVSTQTIVWENNIVNVDEILPGDILKIPPADGLSYIVKPGDTLLAIASRYSIPVENIQKSNIIGNALQINQKLFIPGAEKINEIIVAEVTPEEQTQDQPQQNNQPAPVADQSTNNFVATIPPDSTVTEEIPNLPSTSKLQPKSDQDAVNQVELPQRGDLALVQDQVVVDPDPDILTKPAVAQVTETPVITAPAVIGSPENYDTAPATSEEWGKVTNGQITNGYKAGHYALDIADRSKPPIWASRGGTVITAKYGWNGGYGNYIIIDHGDGYQTLYAHNEELYVEEGEQVVKGQVISKMGNTGNVYGVTGIHVHYECVSDGVKINPHSCMSQ